MNNIKEVNLTVRHDGGISITKRLDENPLGLAVGCNIPHDATDSEIVRCIMEIWSDE